MARKDLTYELVASKCQELFAAGEHTSFDAVYTLIGRQGSAEKVRGYIKQWRQGLATLLSTPRASAVLPEELVGIADNLIEALWTQALQQADRAYNDREAELVKERVTWTDRIAELETTLAEQDRTLLKVRGDLQAREATIDAQQSRIEDLSARHAAAVELVRTKDVTIEDLRTELTRTTTTLENERQRHMAELANAREQHSAEIALVRATGEQELASLRARHATELEAAQEATEGLRKHLMMQTEALRQEALADKTRLQKDAADQKAFAEEYKRQANDARDAAAEARGRAELLAEQLTTLQQQVAANQLRLGELEAALRAAAEKTERPAT